MGARVGGIMGARVGVKMGARVGKILQFTHFFIIIFYRLRSGFLFGPPEFPLPLWKMGARVGGIMGARVGVKMGARVGKILQFTHF